MAYTTIDDPSAYFQTKIYCGTGSSQSLVNDGNSDLQPDLVWFKGSSSGDHRIQNSSRGVTKYLVVNDDGAELTSTNYIDSFNSDGYTIDSGDGSSNTNGNKYMGWQWKINGGTTTTNSDGNRDVTLQVNADAGISIMLYEGSGADGATYGHGLGAVPDMVIMKNIDSGNRDWIVWHSSISPTSALSLGSSGAKFTGGSGKWLTFTSSVIALESYNQINSAESHLAIAMTGIKGYSKFGSWKGNGSGSGPFIHTGFKPAWILWKPTGSSEYWIINDAVRTVSGGACGTDRENVNPVYDRIFPNHSTGASSSTHMMDIHSNGFKIRYSGPEWNGSGSEHIYAAFAEQPFVTSSGVPATAR